MLRKWLPFRSLDLQAKVTLILGVVIVPTFLVVTVAENALTRPWLENEIRQIATGVGQALATEISSSRWLQLENPTPAVERRMQELLYQQPHIVRMDVLVPGDPSRGPYAPVRLIASSVDEDPMGIHPQQELVELPESEIFVDEEDARFWRITLPIESKPVGKAPKRVLGNIQIVGSLSLVSRVHSLLWRSTAVAAFLAFTALFLALRFFLKKTMENERRLIHAESRNLELTERLHEAQRELMNTEKLAVMGQLTASFAHEIGTPLNAMGGHLQLLGMDVKDSRSQSRLAIIRSQLEKIEGIVKGFLQSTAQPPSQRQLVDVNRVIEQTLSIVAPRADSLGVELARELDRNLGPVRAVPVELEQILLNLVNNSLDALQAKKQQGARGMLRLEVRSVMSELESRPAAELEVYDTGEGISVDDLKNVFKPFFTTKRPGQGTGLGLTICQQLANKNGAEIEMKSRKGSWTRVRLRVPYA